MNTYKIHSISRNLTISLVAVIVILSVIFFSVYYYHITKNQKIRLEKTADEYIHSIATTLEVPLWDIDRENIKTVCNYYSRFDFVIMLKLVDVSGEVICHKYMEPRVDEASLIKRSRDIIHKGELIGKLWIVLSPFQSNEANLEFLKVAVTALLVLSAGLIFFTGFLLKRFLKKPMDFLDKIARSYADGNYNPQLQGNPYREFESFVQVLVNMGAKIESQLSELQKADNLLKQHRDHLEEMVILRTRELEESNRELENEIKYRKSAQEALRANEQRLEAILRASPVGIGLVINRNLDWANETMYHMLGYEKDSLLGRRAEILYNDQTEYERVGKELYNRIDQSEIGQVETKLVRKDGSVFDCVIRAYPLHIEDHSKGVIVAVSDISHAKLLETKIQRAEKMEVIGTLAGGVAHDLNNILSGIVSYPELILMDIPEDSPLRKPLLTIQKSGEKAAQIVQDLLTMARRGVCVTDVVNLNRIISEQIKSPEMDKLKSFYPDVEVVCRFETDLLNVKGSATHLSKTVMNLLSNAAEAMPGGGKIIISTFNLYLDTPIKGYEYVEEGDYVIVEVSDTGTGMAKKDIGKIFEPFYTRKEMGRSGTGLGMTVVWGTVKDHNGYIDVRSSRGNGTTFTVYLPVTREKIKENETGVLFEKYRGKGESILVIDDVKEQREIATIILNKLGYCVSSVSSGEEAFEYMKNNSADLLVLDMIMDTGMDGLDAYKKIIELHPKQKAIITSGFSRTDRVKELQMIGAGQYIKKPYTLEKIAFAVKDELRR